VFERIACELHQNETVSYLGVVDFNNLPFRPSRAYWINAMENGESRGFHAHKKLNQVIIILEGIVKLTLYRGNLKFVYNLTNKDPHIVVPFGTWREILSLSEGSSLLVLADSKFEEEDYIRDWNEYLEWYFGKYSES